MYDTELSFHIVEQIRRAIQTIMDRFSTIKSVRDFTDTSRGMEKLDSICMLLIAIGESLKNLDKITHNELLKNYPQIKLTVVFGLLRKSLEDFDEFSRQKVKNLGI